MSSFVRVPCAALPGDVSVGSTRTACLHKRVRCSANPGLCPRAPHLPHLYISSIDGPGAEGTPAYTTHFRCCQPNKCPLASTDAGADGATVEGAAAGNCRLHPHAAAVSHQSHSAAGVSDLRTGAAAVAVAWCLQTAANAANAAQRLHAAAAASEPPPQQQGREHALTVL